MKKFVLAGTFLTHYMLSLFQKFADMPDLDCKFIATIPFSETMLKWGVPDTNQLPFVVRAYESKESESLAHRLIDEADYVAASGIPVNFISSRLKLGRLTFMHSERFFKGPLWKDAVRYLKYNIFHGGRSQGRDKKSKFYLLSTGAFAAWDYRICGLFRNKAYKWGYLPELKKYDNVYGLISNKKKSKILWAGRYIDWKHPEIAVMLAKNLSDMGIEFTMKIAGGGELKDILSGMINAYGLNDFVDINTSAGLTPEQIRKEMEESQIFLFTSDRGEGWGAVLNEAMNSGCAVVAGEKIGAVPYLLKHGKNGLIFRDKDVKDLTEKVLSLLRKPEMIPVLGRNAYETIANEWNPEVAAKRLIKLSEALIESDEPVSLWKDGPGSIAPII